MEVQVKNNKLEKIWKEVVMAYLMHYPRICLDERHVRPDSIPAEIRTDSKVFLLHQPTHFQGLSMYI
jgi:hypothetical protein